MLKFKRLIFVLLFLLIASIPLYSQSGKAAKAIKKQEKAEQSLQRDYKKSRKQELKHRYNIQSPDVQERMKNTEKRVNQYHKQKSRKEFKDIFKRKKPKR